MSPSVQRCRCRVHLLVVLTVLGCGLTTTTARAQITAAASITGKVADETGGALPGVTVTGRSPSLQLPQVTTVSGPDGRYDLRDLPSGTYSVTFELAGFNLLRRDDVDFQLHRGLLGDSKARPGFLPSGPRLCGFPHFM